MKSSKNLNKLGKGNKCSAIDNLIGAADQGEIRDENGLRVDAVDLAQAAGRREIARHGTPTASVTSPRPDDVIAFPAADLGAERAADKNRSTVALGESANCRVAI